MTTETTEETTEEGTAVVPTPEDTQDSRTPEEEGVVTTDTPEDEPKTFDLAYVQKLRKENANYRERAGKVDELSTRLHAALVQASGRLQDPTDLPFDEAHLADPEALTAAIDGLLTSKPHLASRKPQGYIPQGATPEDGATVGLAGLLRAHAS